MKKFVFSGLIEKFKSLSQFKNLKDFNNNIEQWLVDFKSSFTKSELIALKRLIRYCAKHAGVSNAKIQTLVSATNKMNDMGGISRSTFERMLRKAKQFGILQVVNTVKSNGKGKGHNVYVFQRYFLKSTIDVLKERILTYKEKPCNTKPIKDNSIKKESETINLYESSNKNNNNIKPPNVMKWLNSPSTTYDKPIGRTFNLSWLD